MNLPWHRVVSKNGILNIKDLQSRDLQKSLLEEEGIEFVNNQINIEKHLWDGFSN